MPIHVTIKVNETEVRNIHIARIGGGLDRNPFNTHDYAVLDRKHSPVNEKDWDSGAKFTHVYGDDITVCVEKALAALNAADSFV
jgi:hypothetical protein